MKTAEFKPGQQWLSRDGEHKFHIMTIDENHIVGVFIAGDCRGLTVWLYADNGRYWYNVKSGYDLVTLIKDAE